MSRNRPKTMKDERERYRPALTFDIYRLLDEVEGRVTIVTAAYSLSGTSPMLGVTRLSREDEDDVRIGAAVAMLKARTRPSVEDRFVLGHAMITNGHPFPEDDDWQYPFERAWMAGKTLNPTHQCTIRQVVLPDYIECVARYRVLSALCDKGAISKAGLHDQTTALAVELLDHLEMGKTMGEIVTMLERMGNLMMNLSIDFRAKDKSEAGIFPGIGL